MSRENNTYPNVLIWYAKVRMVQIDCQQNIEFQLKKNRLPCPVLTQMTIHENTTISFPQNMDKYSMWISIKIFQNASEIFHIPIWDWPEIGPRSVIVRSDGQQPIPYLELRSTTLHIFLHHCATCMHERHLYELVLLLHTQFPQSFTPNIWERKKWSLANFFFRVWLI